MESSHDDDGRDNRTSEKEKARKDAMEMQKKAFLAAQVKQRWVDRSSNPCDVALKESCAKTAKSVS